MLTLDLDTPPSAASASAALLSDAHSAAFQRTCVTLTQADRWLPVMRVGMPQVRGRLLDLALAAGLPMLLSANAFARTNSRKEFSSFRLDAAAQIPAWADCALDSAGFVASAKYGDYRWPLDAYLDLAAARAWSWYAAPDYCVEPEVAHDAAIRRLRIEATVNMWERIRHRAAQRGMPGPMGVIQGWFADEYVLCADKMFGSRKAHWPAMIGVGSVCRRQLQGPSGVLAILEALDAVMPEGTTVHLFGVKSGGLRALKRFEHRIASADSMAWDAQVRREVPVGRTQEMRAAAMQGWFERQMQELLQLPPERARPLQAALFAAAAREPGLEEIALNAVGDLLGGLHAGNDLEYLDCRHLGAQDAAMVGQLLKHYGAQAFEEEDPENDYGLGTTYAAVREALIECGALSQPDAEVSRHERQRG